MALSAAMQVLANGLVAGSMYALVAVGYTLIYGVLKFINFAHGDVAMVGAYLAVFVLGVMGGTATSGKIAAGLLAGMLGCAVVGVLIERTTYKPLRASPRLQPLIAAIGVSLLLQSVVQLVAGARIRQVALPDWPVVQVLGASVTRIQAAILLLCVLGLWVLHLLVNRTRLGAQIRAVADQMELARVLGINVNRVIAAVFAIGSGLAAVAGIMLGLEIKVQPAMGFALGVKAFAAVVLGGIGSLPGAVIGAFTIGLVENIGAWFTSGIWKEPIAYLVLMLMLLIKPSGLFGGKLDEEVKL